MCSDTTAAHDGKSHSGDAPPAAPHSAAMDLASWNQEELDADTQELFDDTLPQQQVEYCTVTNGSASSQVIVRMERLASKSSVADDYSLRWWLITTHGR